MDVVRVHLLRIDLCPNSVEAGAVARAALGLGDVSVEDMVLRTTSEASAVAFAGSPTILVDGEDAFPSNGRTADLACRVYPTDQGLAGTPTHDQIRDAIRARLR